MNKEPLEKLKPLRLWGMYQAFKTRMEADKVSSLTADELIFSLVNSEWDDRQNRNIERSVRNARFRYQATI